MIRARRDLKRGIIPCISGMRDSTLVTSSKRPPRTKRPCVYLLGFKSTHKVYIGSNLRWPTRKGSHLRLLRRGIHENSYLQRAFDKYGEDDIRFEELEFFPDEMSMRYGEQKWMAYYRSDERQCGFNLVKDALRRGQTGLKRTPAQIAKHVEVLKRMWRDNRELFEHPNRGSPGTYSLFDPMGIRHDFINLAKFCRDRELPLGCMRALVNDRAIECDGWKLTLDRKNPHLTEYDLIGPNDEHVKGTCLNDFSRARGLPIRSMGAMWQGHIKTCRGWRRFDMSIEKAFTHRGKDKIVINSDGHEITVNNLRAFCLKHGLKNDTIRKGYVNQGWKLKS